MEILNGACASSNFLLFDIVDDIEEANKIIKQINVINKRIQRSLSPFCVTINVQPRKRGSEWTLQDQTQQNVAQNYDLRLVFQK